MVSWYPNFAKAHGRDLYELKGLVMYELDQAKIPMYITFIPATMHDNENVEQYIKRLFSDTTTKSYIMYFQAIRWIKTDVAEVMARQRYEPLNYGDIQRPMRIIYANLLLDKTYKSIEPDNIKVIKVPVKFKGTTYKLTVLTDWPDDYGVLKDISPIEDKF